MPSSGDRGPGFLSENLSVCVLWFFFFVNNWREGEKRLKLRTFSFKTNYSLLKPLKSRLLQLKAPFLSRRLFLLWFPRPISKLQHQELLTCSSFLLCLLSEAATMEVRTVTGDKGGLGKYTPFNTSISYLSTHAYGGNVGPFQTNFLSSLQHSSLFHPFLLIHIL